MGDLEALDLYEKYNPINLFQISNVLYDKHVCTRLSMGLRWAVSKFYLNCKDAQEFEQFEMRFKDAISKMSYDKCEITSVYELYREQKKNDCISILDKYLVSNDIINIIYGYV
jgi:hypothetical protein